MLALAGLGGTAEAATPPAQELVVTGSSAAGTYDTGSVTFGPSDFDLTSSATLAVSPGTACDALAPVASGTILVIDRGVCTADRKAGFAQAAGAAGVVIVDSVVSSTPPGFAGTNAAVTIPTSASPRLSVPRSRPRCWPRSR